MVAGGEAVWIILKQVALMQILDSLTKMNSIGSLGLQRLFKLDGNRLATQLDIRLGGQWRRNQYLLGGIVEGNIFVEGDLNLVTLKSYAVIGRLCLDHLGRHFVFRAASGSHRVGATL